RRPGRTGEARRPRQSLAAGRHVLALMLVSARDEQRVKPFLGHELADAGNARGSLGGIGNGLEGLEHVLLRRTMERRRPIGRLSRSFEALSLVWIGNHVVDH